MFLAVVTIGCAAGATFLTLEREATLLTISLAALTVFLAAGLLDLIISRVELGPDAVRIVELHRRRTVPRPEIVRVTNHGDAVFLGLRDGSQVKLPASGRHTVEVLNEVKAWITWTVVP